MQKRKGYIVFVWGIVALFSAQFIVIHTIATYNFFHSNKHFISHYDVPAKSGQHHSTTNQKHVRRKLPIANQDRVKVRYLGSEYKFSPTLFIIPLIYSQYINTVREDNYISYVNSVVFSSFYFRGPPIYARHSGSVSC